MIGAVKRARSEDGSALVMALAFLSLFGLWISSLLTWADVGSRSTVRLRTVASDSSSADAAVESAIAHVRSNLEAGRAGQRSWTCATAMMTGASVGATATCAGGGGVASGGTDNPSNRPANAILTLGTSGSETGVHHGGSTGLRVRGRVFSSSTVVNASTGTMTVDGDVTANAACSGSILSTFPPTHCSDAATVESDPSYLTTISTPASATTPASCPGWLVSFSPGAYRNAAQLNALTSGSCTNKVFHFQPGTYYFDFEDAGSHVWTIADATANVVGGTAKGWSTGAGSKPSPFPFPGGCKTGSDSAPNDGVLFVFGDDSRLSITAGVVELCATPSASSQQIAIYGLRVGSADPPPVGPATAATATATAGSWPNVDRGRIINGQTTNFSSSSPNTATVTLSSYSDLGLPSNATITAVSMRVAHRDEQNVASRSVTITPGGGAPACAPFALHPGSSHSLQTDTVDVTACLNTPEKLGGFIAAFSTVRSSGTMRQRLDGIEFDVTYTAPGTDPQSGCILEQPYPGGSACALLSASGGATKLAVQGTVYAPLSAVDVNLSSVDYRVFARGVIARVFRSAIATATGYADDVVRTPDDCPYPSSSANPVACATGTRTDRQITITVALGASTRIVATVTFVDGTTSPITPGGAVQITSWSVSR